MRITINRLGRIAHASIEIRPLTLLVGENNTNKTWTAYCAYALLRALSEDSTRARLQTHVITKRFAQSIKSLASQAANRIKAAQGSASINLEFSREQILNSIGKEIRLGIKDTELTSVLAAPIALLKGASATLTISRQELERGQKYLFVSVNSTGEQLMYARGNRPLSFAPDHLLALKDADLRKVMREAAVQRMTVTYSSGKEEDWRERLSSLLLEFALSSLGSVIALPAERKALVTLYGALSKDATEHLPIPLKDFIETMRSAQSYAQYVQRRDSGVKRKEDPKIYSRLEEILGGKLAFEESGGGDAILFSPQAGVSLPIQAASSLVRSLAGFALAIQRFFLAGNVIVIDEPEMNAHPSAQLAIVEILTALARLGNYVIVTTHSPYVLDHINNLLAAGDMSPNSRRKAVNKFALKMTESALTLENVSAYEMSPGGKVRNLVDSKRRRIATTTFGDISNKIENLYSELLEMAHK